MLVAVIVAVLFGFGGGWQSRAWKAGHDDAEALRAQAKLSKAGQVVANSAATKHEATRTDLRREARVIIQEVDRVVEKPLYRNVCLDDDGMRQLAAAIGIDPAIPAVTLPIVGAAR